MSRLVWLVLLISCGLYLTRLHVDTDMAAFLPKTASPAQRVLVDQFRDGALSHLVLVAVEGAPPDKLAAISKQMAATLRQDNQFATVQNGEDGGLEQDRIFLWSHRYLLSDRGDANQFTVSGLRTSLGRDLSALGSSAGFLVEHMLPEDPTGEMLRLIEQQQTTGPDTSHGVWFSPDHSRALLLLRLRTGGSDVDGAQRAIAAIRAASPDKTTKLLMTGPPVFAVEARDRIKSDATRLSALAGAIVAASLLTVYRSPLVLGLAFVPVISGALAGITAVGLAFHGIHGITLGFGATLIGEAVDYAVYLFTQSGPGSPVGQTIHRIWPTIRLGMLTSVCGFAAMLWSSFEGFVQLGLFTITGLAAAAGVTRWVLPALVPPRFSGVRESPLMTRLAVLAGRSVRLRPLAIGVVLVALISLIFDPGPFWATDLLSLSPVSPAEQQLDRALRRDIKAPDAGSVIVIRRPDQQAALQAAETVGDALAPLVKAGTLQGFDTPTRYLPSIATQRARQAALPDEATLQKNLDTALDGLPFQPGLFTPFVKDIEAARSAPLLTRTDLDGTTLALKLDALLMQQGKDWIAELSVRGSAPTSAIESVIAGQPDTILVNLKTESDGLLAVYLREGVSLAGLGAGAIVVLLAISLKGNRWSRLLAILAPLGASVVVTIAILRFGGQTLSIFNLFGLLLVVAIGSNYCLFFDKQRADPGGLHQVLASLLLANVCTVAGFGVLALSETPVLHGLGLPVAIGTLLSLIFATITFSPQDHTGGHTGGHATR
jgi:predicted exporter